MEDTLISEVVERMQREEKEAFKSKIEQSIRSIARINAQIKELQKNLAEEKQTFKELKMEATNFAELIV